MSHQIIRTFGALDALQVGAVVALGSEDETVNVALRTSAGKWGLAGQSSPMTTDALFRAAIERDGYTLTVLDTAEVR
jgi:hypothetical protein